MGTPIRVIPVHGAPLAVRSPVQFGVPIRTAVRLGAVHSDVSQIRERGIGTFFGPGIMEVPVTTLNLPSVDRVRLYDRVTGQLVAQQRSRLDGSCRFEGLAITEYVLVGIDLERVWEIVGRDLVVPDDPGA